MRLNQRTWQRCQSLAEKSDRLRIQSQTISAGATCWDFGNDVPGGISAGLELARCCMANLAHVKLAPDTVECGVRWAVQVITDHPVAACMASQYAGWKLASGDFFAMGSGPMRAAAAFEELFDQASIARDSTDRVVGVLETPQSIPEDIVQQISRRCNVAPDGIVLLVARTASQAGTVQVVARSIETTLHKLLDLGYDLSRVQSAAGIAPLPPVAKDDLAGIGRTNDAILYGARVTLWVEDDDAQLESLVEKIPSRSSSDYGQPFAETFAKYDYDFYQIDPHLFSPAAVQLMNLRSGHTFRSGEVAPNILAKSFGS